MTKILHSYSDYRFEDQVETHVAVQDLRDEGWNIESRKVVNPDGYWKFMLESWGKYDPIINIEQDIVPDAKKLESLLACKELACTYPYTFPNKQWSLWKGVFLDGWDNPRTPKMVFYDKDGPIRMDMLQPIAFAGYDPPFPDFVECSGLGLAKISLQVQNRLPLVDYPIARHKWNYMDSWMSYYMQQKLHLPWHVHSPVVKHNHYND